MPKGGKETDLSQGVLTRLVQGARYAVSGVKPDAWFGPSQPLVPMAPASVEGRQFDYPVGYNLDQRPRGYEPVGFNQLRALADNCDVLRSVIETRKDQMDSQDWCIRTKAKDGKISPDQQARIDEITAFFMCPDKVNNWSQWLRMLLEERFVTDAACIYKRRDRKGDLYSLSPIDGATIKILIDGQGQRPLAPDPAYQQVLKGIPAVDYTTEELLYLMRNPRVWKVYGYSEVEQVIVTVNIAIRRTLFQLEYYREGSQPDAFLGMPKEWDAKQITAFQEMFDARYAGNLAARRRLTMIPDGGKYQETKQPPMKDEYDEWLTRIICFIFSISPQPFIKQMNRATADTAHDAAQQEGLAPLQRWVKNFIDPIITLDFESPDLEFAWQDDREQDPMQAAAIRQGDVKAGIISIDAARESIGEQPMGGAFAKPMAFTASGYVPVDPEERVAMTPPPMAPGAQGDEEDTTHDHKPAEKAAYSRLRKAGRPKPIPFDRPATRKGRKALKAAIASVLAKAAEAVAGQLSGHMAKADEDNEAKANRIADALDLSSLDLLVDVVPGPLTGVLSNSGRKALAQIGVEDRGELVNQVNARAVAYARERAAEMVGKKYEDGELVDNPNAFWRIDEATRDELRIVIRSGLDENIGLDGITKAIYEAGAFSEDRAELIANTEVGTANSQGALDGYKVARDAGVKLKKSWLPDSDPCPECQENADAGAIDLDEEFPSGDQSPLAHPGCECTLLPEVETENEEDEE